MQLQLSYLGKKELIHMVIGYKDMLRDDGINDFLYLNDVFFF